MRYNILDNELFKQKFLICERLPLDSIIPIEYGEQKSAPGTLTPLGIRLYYVIHYIKSGFGSFTINQKTYLLKPGDIFIIPPYKKISYTADQANPWSYAWLKFDLKGTPPSFLSSPVLNAPSVGPIFEEMREALKLDNPTLYLTSKAYSLFHMLTTTHENQQDSIDNAINFIHAKFSSNIKIEDLANHVGYTRSYFSTSFTKKVGMSPQKYILKIRMETAADLMITHNASPSVAAQTVGYIDFYLFSKMFKRYFGQSPRQYIKNNSKK